MLNQWSLLHFPKDVALNHEGIMFSTLLLRPLLSEELSTAEKGIEIKPTIGHQHLFNQQITKDIQFKKLLTLHKFLTPG